MSRIEAKFIIFDTVKGVNGARIPVNYTPVNYAPVQVTTEGADKISAHFKGLDVAFSAAAAPSLSFGRSGVVSGGAYLLNNSVPSNISGCVSLVPGKLDQVSFVAENSGTYVIEIQKRVGASFATVITMTISAKRIDVQSFEGTSIAYKDELACRILSGNPKNPVVGIMVRRNTA